MLIEAEDRHFSKLLQGISPTGHSIAEGGLAPDEVLQMLRELALSISQNFTPAAWLLLENDEIVGLCSLLKPPSPEGAMDIGYGIAESRRGRGCGRRAIAEILAWAAARPDIKMVQAETSIHNFASQRILERNGFHRVGERIDAEDGALICWAISS